MFVSQGIATQAWAKLHTQIVSWISAMYSGSFMQNPLKSFLSTTVHNSVSVPSVCGQLVAGTSWSVTTDILQVAYRNWYMHTSVFVFVAPSVLHQLAAALS